MKAAISRMVGLLAAFAAPLAFAQASLPTSWSGPWQYGVPDVGWVLHGLGGPDYNPDYDGLNNGAAKLDGTGDYISIHYTNSAGSVSYWVKGLTFSGGVFRVEQSVDGSEWADLAVYTAPPTNAAYQTHFPDPAARYIRFIYAEKITGNVGLDGISIAAFIRPEILDLQATGGVVRVTMPASTSGRSYALDQAPVLTNEPVAWTQADSQTGTGSSLVLRDLAPTSAVRFYRVRDATP